MCIPEIIHNNKFSMMKFTLISNLQIHYYYSIFLFSLLFFVPSFSSICTTCPSSYFTLASNCSICLPLQCPPNTELQRGRPHQNELLCMPSSARCEHACPKTLIREHHTCSCIKLIIPGNLWGISQEGPYYSLSNA